MKAYYCCSFTKNNTNRVKEISIGHCSGSRYILILQTIFLKGILSYASIGLLVFSCIVTVFYGLNLIKTM